MWWGVTTQIGIYTYIPGPSKGCQMVAKGCQFNIPWGLIGTPWKVLVYIYIFHTITLKQNR